MTISDTDELADLNTGRADLHTVSYWQGVWSAIRGRAPRALCGVSLEGRPGDVDRADAPPCPDCEARIRGARPMTRPVAHPYATPVRVRAHQLGRGDVIEGYEEHGPVVSVACPRWRVRVTTADGTELEWGRLDRAYVVGKDEPEVNADHPA